MAKKATSANTKKNAAQYLDGLTASLSFMATELERLEGELSGVPATVEYIDSQGNQREKQNPMRAEYRDLFRTFCTGISTLEKVAASENVTEAKPALDRFKVIKGARAVGDD